MKTELVDVSDTRKNLRVEIPADTVDAELTRVTARYGQAARLPGFRPGKVPARVIRQRFKGQILQDTAEHLVGHAVEDALSERGLQPVDSPDIKDLVVKEGEPLTFTAIFDVVPPFDPGDLSTIELRKAQAAVEDEAVNQALERLRDRAARFEPVEGTVVAAGHTAVVDLVRQGTDKDGARGDEDRHTGVSIEMGAAGNPPGFDDQVVGMSVGEAKSFSITYPNDYSNPELAGGTVDYTVTVREIKKRVVPALDDEFAKDLGEFETIGELRQKLRDQLQRAEERRVDRETKAGLVEALAARGGFEVPDALVERHMSARTENLVRGLAYQGIDPRNLGVDWRQYRESTRDDSVRAARADILLDEIARREGIQVMEGEIDAEIARIAERAGRSKEAVRAQMAKEGDVGALAARIREEKTLDLLKANATIELS